MRKLLPLLLVASTAAPAFAQTGGESSAPPPPANANGGAADGAESVDMTLREAYKREFAFLAGQKRQLEQRLERVEKNAEREARSAQGEITGLESRLLGLEAKTKALQEELLLAEQASQSSSDDKQLIDSTINQSATTLKDYGITLDLPEDAPKDQRLTASFDKATELLRKLSSVNDEPGAFYLADGKEVEGTLVRVGRIAAYGVSAEGSGVLFPVGGGKLKIWKDPAAEDATALASGNVPGTLSIYLYESETSAVDDSGEQTAYEHVDSGGSIAWVIVVLGIFGIFLAAVRAVMLWMSSGNTSKLEQQVGELVGAQRIDEAVQTAKSARGSAARVLASVLTSIKGGTEGEDLDDVIGESMLKESRTLNRFNAIILVIAGVAPLLGLLGTVTGMISTFDVITKFGTGDPKMLSGGISTALVTTELGLIVAIPTLLLGSLLKGWGDGIENEADRVVLKVVNIHKDTQNDSDGGAPAEAAPAAPAAPAASAAPAPQDA